MFALITGGAKGLGRSLASAVLKRGGNVVVADVDGKAGADFEKDTFDELGEKRLKFIECNVADTNELERAFDFCKKEFGQLTVVCNNAAIMTSSVERSHEQIDINLAAVVDGTFKAVEAMSVTNGGNGGVIINIASGSGYNILRSSPVYTATKFGVVGFSRAFKFLPHFSEDKVRVNCLCPLFLATEMTQKAIEENPEVEFQLSDVGYSSVEDVVTSFFSCIDDELLNGEIIAMHNVGGIYQLKFRQPIPVPLKTKIGKSKT